MNRFMATPTVEELEEEIERKCKVIDIAYDRCIKAEAEIERLTATSGAVWQALNKANADIERLTAILEKDRRDIHTQRAAIGDLLDDNERLRADRAVEDSNED